MSSRGSGSSYSPGSRSSGSSGSSRSRSKGKGKVGAAKSRRSRKPTLSVEEKDAEKRTKLRQTWLNRYFKDPVDSFNQYGDALLSHHKINGKFVESHARVLNVDELTGECINKKYIYESWDLRGKNASRIFGREFSNYVILKKMTFSQSLIGTEVFLYFAKDTPANLGRELEAIPAGEKFMSGINFPVNPLGYGTGMLYNI